VGEPKPFPWSLLTAGAVGLEPGVPNRCRAWQAGGYPGDPGRDLRQWDPEPLPAFALPLPRCMRARAHSTSRRLRRTRCGSQGARSPHSRYWRERESLGESRRRLEPLLTHVRDPPAPRAIAWPRCPSAQKQGAPVGARPDGFALLLVARKRELPSAMLPLLVVVRCEHLAHTKPRAWSPAGRRSMKSRIPQLLAPKRTTGVASPRSHRTGARGRSSDQGRLGLPGQGRFPRGRYAPFPRQELSTHR